MSPNPILSPRNVALGLAMALLVTAGSALAQDTPANTTQNATPAQQQNPTTQDGWKRFNGGWSNPPASSSPRANAAEAQNPAATAQVEQNADPNAQAAPADDPQGTPQDNPQNPPADNPLNGQANAPAPASGGQLTIPAGTYLTVRVNQALSSDRNQAGDSFSATLAQPVIVNGIVVAQRGQIVGGRVAEAKKAGVVSGVSHLGLELTDLTLADGQNVAIQSKLVKWNGPTSVGRDVAAVGTTTALGAAVGAAADWGRGAAIGAGAGAAVGLVGVLLTRGRPTIVYPETQLTFQVSAPVTVDTEHAPQAFHAAGSDDYQQSTVNYDSQAPRGPCGPYGCPPYPYPYYAYYGPGYYPYPYYWGPGFGFYYGRGFYGRRYYGGFRGGYRH
jgi:hypothetical protein